MEIAIGPVEQARLLIAAAGDRLDDAAASVKGGRFVPACVMVGESLEAGLLAQAYVFEPELRRARLWTDMDKPLKWTLDRLISMAIKMRWLPSAMDQVPNDQITEMLAGEVGDAVHFVRYLRNITTHPAKHVAEVPWLTVTQHEADLALGIADAVFERLHANLEALA